MMQRFLAFAAVLTAAPLAQLGSPGPEIIRALGLPALATEARQAGVSEAAVRDVLDALRGRGLPADEAALVVREEVDAVHAGAPKDNFGSFVHRQLEAGLRGRALAEAIHAEHQARGMGRPGGEQPHGRDTTKVKRRSP
jgi:hypothetical protein